MVIVHSCNHMLVRDVRARDESLCAFLHLYFLSISSARALEGIQGKTRVRFFPLKERGS
jgi:hypothetical protein